MEEDPATREERRKGQIQHRCCCNLHSQKEKIWSASLNPLPCPAGSGPGQAASHQRLTQTPALPTYLQPALLTVLLEARDGSLGGREWSAVDFGVSPGQTSQQSMTTLPSHPAVYPCVLQGLPPSRAPLNLSTWHPFLSRRIMAAVVSSTRDLSASQPAEPIVTVADVQKVRGGLLAEGRFAILGRPRTRSFPATPGAI